MSPVTPSNAEAKAFPIIVQNTFISVDLGLPSAPRRRCSSLPPMGKKAFDGYDSEAGTDICTDIDELATFSDSGNTTEGEPQDVAPCLSSIPQRTRLNARAAMYAPVIGDSVPPPPPPPLETGIVTTVMQPVAIMQPAPTMWKMGQPKNRDWVQWWEETSKSVVAKMCMALGKADSVSRVECSNKGAGWTVVIRSKVNSISQFERILSSAKEALLQAAEEPPCLYIMGHRRLPFQPTSMGFFASLGSMTNTKKACWDVYDKGFCPRGCACTWEHPALVETVTVTVVFSETDKPL